MNVAVLIIDMINEYANPKGNIYCQTVPSIIPNINKLISFGRDRKWPVIFVDTELDEKDHESILYRKWGPQARAGTWACQVIEEIKKEKEDIIIPKTTFDGFYNTNLEEILISLNIKNTIIVGIHTHVCVHFTAMSAANRNFNVIALEDCMTTGYAENHNSRLRLYQTHIGELYKLDNLIENYK
jgi:nicotinamidase-related amidase